MKNIIVGHSYKRNNSWKMVFGLVAAGIFLFFIILIVDLNAQREASLPNKPQGKKMKRAKEEFIKKPAAPEIKKDKEIKKTAGIEILKKAICRSIQNNQPVDIVSSVPPETKVYAYVRVMVEDVPNTVSFVWIPPSGEVYARIDLPVRNQPADLWSYVSLPSESDGEWKVEVLVGKKVVDVLSFKVAENI